MITRAAMDTPTQGRKRVESMSASTTPADPGERLAMTRKRCKGARYSPTRTDPSKAGTTAPIHEFLTSAIVSEISAKVHSATQKERIVPAREACKCE